MDDIDQTTPLADIMTQLADYFSGLQLARPILIQPFIKLGIYALSPYADRTTLSVSSP